MTDFLESLFYVFWRGLAIGIMISAPMGPVGMLCIQRTLYKGRLTGLYTGIGAAASDLFYCLLTGFGLSFIEDFLTRNQNVIQLLGSGVLIGFAIYLLRKNPVASLRGSGGDDTASPRKDILGGFLFTFSNPLILFLIVGLFARFNFLSADIKWYHYVVGYLAIVAGALGWWWIVTYTVNRVRAHFNLRSMWLVNRIIGLIILIFGIVGLVTGASALASASPRGDPAGRVECWNASRGFGHWSPAPAPGERLSVEPEGDAMLVMDDGGVGDSPFSFSWRLSCHTPSLPQASGTDTLPLPDGGWMLALTDASGAGIAISGLASEPDRRRSLGENPQLMLRVFTLPEGTVIAEHSPGKADCYGGPNHFILTRHGRDWSLVAGNRAGGTPLSFATPEVVSVERMELRAGRKASVALSEMTLRASRPSTSRSVVDVEQIQVRLDSACAPLDGEWGVLDRTLDESYLRPGGDYTLAILSDFPQDSLPSSYTMHYLSGAKVHSGSWLPGQVKGRLYATPFEDVYDVEWTDAAGDLLSHDIRARHEADGTLTILFPRQNSELHLSPHRRR